MTGFSRVDIKRWMADENARDVEQSQGQQRHIGIGNYHHSKGNW